MKFAKKIVVAVFAFVSCFSIGASSSFAYSILHSGGFTPVSTDVHCLSSLANESKLAISSACQVWNAAGCGSLVFRGTDSTVTTYPYENNRNDITKGDRGSGEYLMQTYYTTHYYSFGKWYISEADIDINVNSSMPWGNDGASNHYDIQNCITHELGHLLGLDEENSQTESTMYYEADLGETKKRSLAQDDINGLNVIY